MGGMSVPWWAALAAMATWFAVSAPHAASAETVRIEGSAGFAQELMEPYKQQIEEQTGETLELTANTSPDGLLAVLNGKAGLAMIWAPLDGVVALLRKTSPDHAFQRLHEFRIAKSSVAFAVNPDNPVRFASRAKLKEILNGHIDNWRTLGGPDLPIHIVVLRNGGGVKRAPRRSC